MLQQKNRTIYRLCSVFETKILALTVVMEYKQ
jgi:hypothetical protein